MLRILPVCAVVLLLADSAAMAQDQSDQGQSGGASNAGAVSTQPSGSAEGAASGISPGTAVPAGPVAPAGAPASAAAGSTLLFPALVAAAEIGLLAWSVNNTGVSASP